MARGKGKLSQALAKQLQREKVQADKRKKIQNRQSNFELKPKQKVVQVRKPLVPYGPDDRILLVGEGDFSYSHSILDLGLIKPDNLIATSFDSYKDVCEKYPGAEDHIEALKALGVRVYHEIDATALNRTLGIQGGNKRQGNGSGKTIEVLGSLHLNNIVFNFPHVGRGIKDISRNVRANQELLQGFFKSARVLFDILHFQRDQTIGRSALAAMSVEEAEWNYLHQKEMKPVESDKEVMTITLFEGEPYDSWMVKKLARESIGYQVQRSGAFDWEMYKGYEHRRTAGMGDTHKVAAQRAARIYKFERYKRATQVKADDGSDTE